MAFGFQFVTHNGRTFRLDEIQPYVYLGSYKYVTIGTKTFSFPELAGIAEIMVSCDHLESSADGGKKMSWSGSANISNGTYTLNLVCSGRVWSEARFSVFARFL